MHLYVTAANTYLPSTIESTRATTKRVRDMYYDTCGDDPGTGIAPIVSARQGCTAMTPRRNAFGIATLWSANQVAIVSYICSTEQCSQTIARGAYVFTLFQAGPVSTFIGAMGGKALARQSYSTCLRPIDCLTAPFTLRATP